MFTDLANFTARTHEDEPRTLRLLGDHRALVRAAVAKFGGREVKTMGDGFLLEFQSAVDATRCAVEIRDRSRAWTQASEEERPEVRISLHLGEVVDEQGDILGDAVNVASRLESLAEPGGICVSAPVYEAVHNKVPFAFELLPPSKIRGLGRTLEVYRLLPSDLAAGAARAAPPGRIAVLPFASISPDPQDEYLADGLTEELITTLSNLGGLRVIARTSVEAYRGSRKPVHEIGAELRVRTLLEGSVRKVDRRIRITTQLIDGPTQEHLWSKSYDRNLDDVFALQSDIAREVAEVLRVKVAEHEARRIRTKPTGNTESYLAYLRGRTLLEGLTGPSLEEARAQFETSVRLDPRNARAWVGLADTLYRQTALGITDRPLRDVDAVLASCRDLVSQALLLDPDAAEGHASLGYFLNEHLEFGPAEKELRLAITLNPSYANAHQWYARLLTEKGQLDYALEELRIAEEADPLSPGIQFGLVNLLTALAEPEAAASRLARLQELEPEGVRYHLARFEACAQAHDPQGLAEEARWITEHGPGQGTPERRAYWFARCYALGEKPEQARTELRALEEALRLARDPSSEWAARDLAEVFAELRDLGPCFAWLERALENRTLTFQPWWLRPSLAQARSDPRFHKLLGRAGLA